MKKILVIGKYYPPYRGGIEANTEQVCQALADKGMSVTALVNNHEAGQVIERNGRLKIIRRHVACKIFSQPIGFSLFKNIDLNRYDLIHFHAPNPYAGALLCVKILLTKKVPRLVITHHMDIFGRGLLRKATLPFYKYLLRKADPVIVTSFKNAALSKDLSSAKLIKEVPLGIHLEDFSLTDVARQEAARWRNTLVGEAQTIGFVGRIARYKGLDVLLESLKLIPNVHLLIGGMGEHLESLKQTCEKFGLVGRVHFVGQMTHYEKIRLFASTDVFAFPSTEITEAFGISQLEAMAMGVPVVATNLGTGVNDVSIDGVTALLCRPSDHIDLAEKLTTLLTNKSLASKLSANARNHVESRFVDSKVSALLSSIILSEI